jgi:hypothetical protein
LARDAGTMASRNPGSSVEAITNGDKGWASLGLLIYECEEESLCGLAPGGQRVPTFCPRDEPDHRTMLRSSSDSQWILLQK